MINDNFLNGVAALVRGSSVYIPSFMAKGSVTGVITAQDTAPSGEFGSRVSVTKTATNNEIKFISLFLAPSSGSTPINNIALMTLSSGGALWANMLIPSLIQTSAFDVDVEIWVDFIRG